MLKGLLISFILSIPAIFGVEQNNDIEYKKIYSEPLLITHNIDGTFTFDLSTADSTIKIIFIVPIKVECDKDTVVIKPGYKKF